MNDLPTGTVTFLFTDIEGSTRLWGSHPGIMRDSLSRHDALLREAVTAADGIVFKTVGDAFCVAFTSVKSALSAAVAIQIALLREPWPEETPIRVRIALHTGQAQERDYALFSPVLNRTSRLLSAGHGGQTLVSAATWALAQGILPPGLRFRDFGLHRLKDLERPEQVFQLIHPELPEIFPPLRTLEQTPNNLPQQVTSFIGREKELETARGLLSTSRLLTLTGSGGSGKSRLSLQLAAEVLEDFPEGTWLVELASLTDPALIPQTVAQVFGIKEQAGRPLLQSLTELWREKRLLLILDNCEHLLTGCASFVATLIRACPGVRVLATSREPLGIAGEQTYRVPSLSLPELGQEATPESLNQFEAIRLFVDRAQAVKPNFAVTRANAPALVQSCIRLDGIPLAIELAAARVRSLAIEQINERLDSRFRFLTGGDRSALPRQQTLRALVDWSYDLLSETEKTVFARLSVFASGWTIAAAEAVCGFDPVEDWEILDLLTGLVDKSLVVADTLDTATNTGTTRYRLLETLRQYAAEKLEANGEAGVVQARHRDYFIDFAEAASPHLVGPEQGVWYGRIETEHDNFRTALNTSATGSEPGAEGAAPPGLRLSAVLWRFWNTRGYLTEGREQILRALETETTADSPAQVRARSRAMNGAGILALGQSDYEAARAFLNEALSLSRVAEDKAGTGSILVNLGNIALAQGDLAPTQTLYEEALTLFRELDYRPGIAMALVNLGNVRNFAGDMTGARALYDEAMPLYRELGDLQNLAMTLNNLGSVAYAQGDGTAARALFDESLEVRRTLGNKEGIAMSLSNLGVVVHSTGDPQGAKPLLLESLTLLRDLGNKRYIALTLEGLASTCRALSAFRVAAVLWGASLALRDSIHAPLTAEEQSGHTEEAAKIREVLGEEAYVAARNEGNRMGLEEAISFALNH